MAKRGLEGRSGAILEADSERRSHVVNQQELEPGATFSPNRLVRPSAPGNDTSVIEAQGAEIRDEISAHKGFAEAAAAKLQHFLSELPNILDDDVPDGRDETDNAEQNAAGRYSELASRRDSISKSVRRLA